MELKKINKEHIPETPKLVYTGTQLKGLPKQEHRKAQKQMKISLKCFLLSFPLRYKVWNFVNW